MVTLTRGLAGSPADASRPRDTRATGPRTRWRIGMVAIMAITPGALPFYGRLTVHSVTREVRQGGTTLRVVILRRGASHHMGRARNKKAADVETPAAS